MQINVAKSMLMMGLVLPFAGFTVNSVSAQTNIQAKAQAVSMADVMNYLQQSAALQNEIDMAVAPVKSKKDLQIYLATARDSPLDALSLAAKQRFLASLVFTDKGLGSFEYVDLESELTPTQIYRILSLFGVQHDTALMKGAHAGTDLDRQILNFWPPTPGDHMNYYCGDGQGGNLHTCYPEKGPICTSNC